MLWLRSKCRQCHTNLSLSSSLRWYRSPAQYQILQQQKQHQMLQQMQREQSENEMNGHRPQSPASTENAGSPSKRPRLEGQQFAGGPMAPTGRGQGGPQQQQQQAMNMLMASGMGEETCRKHNFSLSRHRILPCRRIYRYMLRIWPSSKVAQ